MSDYQPPQIHDTGVLRRQHGGRITSWTPRCSCGWRGPDGLTREEAERMAALHSIFGDDPTRGVAA